MRKIILERLALEKLLTVGHQRTLVIVLRIIVDRALGIVLRRFQFGKVKWPSYLAKMPPSVRH